MTRKFIETSGFTRKVDGEGVGLLLAIQFELLLDPEAGPVIPGTGGIRKLRVADEGRGKGKRGGYRVLYLDIPTAEKSYLLGLYGKGEKTDISEDEKKALRSLVKRLKSEVPT